MEKVITDDNWKNCMFDNIIKFGIAGKFTDDNINLLLKGKGKMRSILFSHTFCFNL